MNSNAEAIFYEGLKTMGLDAEREGAKKVLAYLDLMLEKNRVMNLSAIREEEVAVRLHGLDALSVFSCLDLKGKTILDVGTGGGVPGALIALYEPETKVSLLDSTAKKLAFVEEACTALDAKADFYAERAEVMAQSKLREKFDVVTARAVASLPALCELCLPFVKKGGVFAAYKANAAEELALSKHAIATLGGEELSHFDYTIPGEKAVRCIILIKKVSPSPVQYPRAWAKIKAKPL